jgi:hypothetical protein
MKLSKGEKCQPKKHRPKTQNPQFQIFEPQTKTKPEVTHSHLNLKIKTFIIKNN